MALIKRERPITPLAELATWPDEWFDRVFRDMFREYFPARLDRMFETGPRHVMHLEEFVEKDTCVIRAEMPDLDPEKDIAVSVREGVLTLQAHREERKEEERPEGYRSEFHYGTFVRRIRLPEGVTEADVKASYKDGILEVRVPMPAEAVEAAPTKIEVEHE